MLLTIQLVLVVLLASMVGVFGMQSQRSAQRLSWGRRLVTNGVRPSVKRRASDIHGSHADESLLDQVFSQTVILPSMQSQHMSDSVMFTARQSLQSELVVIQAHAPMQAWTARSMYYFNQGDMTQQPYAFARNGHLDVSDVNESPELQFAFLNNVYATRADKLREVRAFFDMLEHVRSFLGKVYTKSDHVVLFRTFQSLRAFRQNQLVLDVARWEARRLGRTLSLYDQTSLDTVVKRDLVKDANVGVYVEYIKQLRQTAMGLAMDLDDPTLAAWFAGTEDEETSLFSSTAKDGGLEIDLVSPSTAITDEPTTSTRIMADAQDLAVVDEGHEEAAHWVRLVTGPPFMHLDPLIRIGGSLTYLNVASNDGQEKPSLEFRHDEWKRASFRTMDLDFPPDSWLTTTGTTSDDEYEPDPELVGPKRTWPLDPVLIWNFGVTPSTSAGKHVQVKTLNLVPLRLVAEDERSERIQLDVRKALRNSLGLILKSMPKLYNSELVVLVPSSKDDLFLTIVLAELRSEGYQRVRVVQVQPGTGLEHGGFIVYRVPDRAWTNYWS